MQTTCLLFKPEFALQTYIVDLNKICEQYDTKLSTAKTKVMGFRGKEPVGTKFIISDQSIDHGSHFYNLGNHIGCDKDYSIDVKLGKFQKIC